MSQDARGPVLWQALCWVQICTRLAKPGDPSESDAVQFSAAHQRPGAAWSWHTSGTGAEEAEF